MNLNVNEDVIDTLERYLFLRDIYRLPYVQKTAGKRLPTIVTATAQPARLPIIAYGRIAYTSLELSAGYQSFWMESEE